MSDRSEFEFMSRLSDFGLSNKEARLYYHLLKHGAKPPAVIARHMQTHRKDVHRTLDSLLDKGMIAKSMSTPTVYVAVPPETALDIVVRRHKLQQQERATLKQDLVELAETVATEDEPPEWGCPYRVLRGPNEADAVTTQMASEVAFDISVLMPGPMLNVFYQTGQLDMITDRLRSGVRGRLVTDISRANLTSARYAVKCGAELRHVEPSGGVQFTVYDARRSLVLIRFDPDRFPLKDASITFFLCESPTYARSLMYHYERAWEQAIDGAERIRALEELYNVD